MPPEPADLCASVRLDLVNACLWRGAQRIPLRPKTFAVLRCLLVHSGQLVTKATLLDAVWPETTVTDVALMICIRELRQALGDNSRSPRFIETMHRRGYRFVGDLPMTAPPSGSPQSVVRSAVPPVGREAALARLHAWLALARRGIRQVVFVTGETGLGKTTLVEAFVAELGNHGTLWIGRGQCVEHYGAGEAYLPVLEALGRLCRGPGGREMVALLGQQAPTWLVQMPGLVRDADLEALRRRIGGATQERMLRELAEALELLTAQQPLVLVLEDLHWSDPSTLDLIAILARRREPARLLLIGTYRSPEVLRRAHPLHTVQQELQLHGHCMELPLTLLPEDAVAAYLASRLPGLPLVDRLAHLVHQRTEGNPLFMVTLLESWLTHGVLLEQDGVWTLPAGVEALQDRVPDSLRQMIDRQLDGLSAEEQRVLEAASVAGVEFSAAAVAAGLVHEAEHVDDWCTSLARRGQFLRTSGERIWPDGTVAGCYSFVHVLYQQVLHQRVSAAQRVRLHQRIGARLEVGHGPQASAMAAELAMHFERGRDAQRAVQYLRQAGERSMERSAYVEAVAHFTRGREVLQTLPDTPERSQHELDLLIALAKALRVTKSPAAPELEPVLIRAAALTQQVGEPSQHTAVLYALWGFRNVRAENHAAQAVAEQLLDLAQRQHDPALLLVAYHTLGVTLGSVGAFALARTHLEQGIALSDAQRQATPHPGLVQNRGANFRALVLQLLWALGYPDQAVQRSQEALTMAHALAHPLCLAEALRFSARLYAYRREWQTAQAHAEALLALATEHGLARYVAYGTFFRGWTLAAQGQGVAGIAQMRQGRDALRPTGAMIGIEVHALAEAYGQVGQVDEGLHLLAEALARKDTTGGRSNEAELHRLHGELLHAECGVRNAEVVAEECFQQALAVARRQQARSYELRAAMSLSRLWQQQGKRAEARQLLAPIYGWFTEGFDTADLQEAKTLLTDLA
jgi:DNA-binding winged helix-turn-helix (wHTH) protein/tetratricopeptide (TPR) repeat protein